MPKRKVWKCVQCGRRAHRRTWSTSCSGSRYPGGGHDWQRIEAAAPGPRARVNGRQRHLSSCRGARCRGCGCSCHAARRMAGWPR